MNPFKCVLCRHGSEGEGGDFRGLLRLPVWEGTIRLGHVVVGAAVFMLMQWLLVWWSIH